MNSLRATRLIVTADDFGAGLGRNAGIMRAWQDGVVTGTSLLANGPAFADAVRLARKHGLPVGVHLNLADYQPLSGPIRGLTDPQGRFLGKSRSRAALLQGHFDREALQREFAAQIDRVVESGLHPQALDSHQHAHLFPGVTEVVIALARTYHLHAVRNPSPAEPAATDPGGGLGADLALYRRLAPACSASLRAAGLDLPDGLFGMPLLDRLDEPTLLQLVATLPPGTWEVMTHPGIPDATDPFGGTEREREMSALTAPALRQCLRQRRIALISFQALNPSCAS